MNEIVNGIGWFVIGGSVFVFTVFVGIVIGNLFMLACRHYWKSERNKFFILSVAILCNKFSKSDPLTLFIHNVSIAPKNAGFKKRNIVKLIQLLEDLRDKTPEDEPFFNTLNKKDSS